MGSECAGWAGGRAGRQEQGGRGRGKLSHPGSQLVVRVEARGVTECQVRRLKKGLERGAVRVIAGCVLSIVRGLQGHVAVPNSRSHSSHFLLLFVESGRLW